jgi:hypothetical protein
VLPERNGRSTGPFGRAEVPSDPLSTLSGPLEPRWHADPSTINTIQVEA